MQAKIVITFDAGHVNVEAPLIDQPSKDLVLMMLGKAVEAVAIHQAGSLILPASKLPTLTSKEN